MNFQNLDGLLRFFGDQGCHRVLVKELAGNDNSKNQIYLGSDFSVLNLLPFSAVSTDDKSIAGSKRERLKAVVKFAWADDHLSYNPANLILYPRYPEVRISGLLKAKTATNHVANLIRSRDPGRLLFLGVTPCGQVVGHCAGQEEEISRSFHHRLSDGSLSKVGVFHSLALRREADDPVDSIVSALKPIVDRDWIRSTRLNSSGENVSCESPNCGGYTLEALLGIIPNGISEPDYQGWEVKQYGVTNFESSAYKAITLLTPEPDGGFYRNEGVIPFVKRYGYPDRRISDRLNFGGVHRADQLHSKTGLTLRLSGYSESSPNMWDPQGAICLVDQDDHVAAQWGFGGLLEHWNRKHAQTVYVRSMVMKEPERAYNYSNKIQLGVETSFNYFLRSLSRGEIYYDPGIKIENTTSGRPKSKRRSQFRVKSTQLDGLYKKFESKVI